MRSSIRTAAAMLGMSVVLMLGGSATMAVADDSSTATLPLTISAVHELPDPVTGLQATQDAQGAYRGDIRVSFQAVPDPGQQLLPFNATVSYPTRDGGTDTATAYVDGTAGFFTLDTRGLPDGDNTLSLSATEGADITSTDTTPVTGTLGIRTANPSAGFTSPAPNSVAWGTTTWTVDAAPAADGAAIDRVEFYPIGYNKTVKPVHVATSAPYSYTSNVAFPNPYQEMQAVAVDKDGYRSAVASVNVAAEPGPTVTAEGFGPLDAEGTQQLSVQWSAAVADGLNFDPAGWNATTWLTQAVVAIDGHALETDDLTQLPLQCPHTAYHCLSSTPWMDQYDLSDLALGDHTVTVTVTDNLGGVGIASFTAVVAPDKLVVSTSAKTVAWGGSVGVYGLLTGATGTLLPGARVALQALPAGSRSWTTVSTQTVNNALYDMSVTPQRNESLRVVELSGTHQVGAATAVTVQPKITAKASATTVTHGRTIKVTGQVTGKSPGAAVRLLVARNGKWVTLATTHQSATGTVTFSVPERTKGTLSYRLYSPATTTFGAGYGPTLTVRVR